MEYTAVFEESVSLTPKDLRSAIKNLDTVLEGKLRSRLEGKCSRHGYVLSDSIRLLSRSMGTVDRGRFTGNILFHVQAEGKVLNPPDKTILDGEVIRKNKMGLYVNYRDAIRIIIPRDANIGKDEFELVELGETITVEIKKSRFQVNDEYILSVGLFIGRKEGVAKVPVTDEKEEESESEESESEESESEEEEEEESKEEEAPARAVGGGTANAVAANAVAAPAANAVAAPAAKRPFQIRRKM
jgi:DNA-directed RNA polymerase subunit E'/Rpb7